MKSTRRNRRLAGLVLIAVLATTPVATAGTFDPEFKVSASPPHLDRLSQFTVEVAQKDFEDLIRDYRVEIPAGWRFAVASISASNFDSCDDAATQGNPNYNASNIRASQNMEAMGNIQLLLSTDATRDPDPQPHPENATQVPNVGGAVTNPDTADDPYVSAPGPAVYDGGGPSGVQGRPEAALWFLRWDEPSKTAIMCATLRTRNLRISPPQREIIFQIELKLMPDGSWVMRWDLDAVPRAAAGFRSVTDNPVFVNGHVSIHNLRMTITQTTGGRFNKECPGGGGGTCRVEFSFTPKVQGVYPVTGTLARCPAEAGSCPLSPVTRIVELLISDPSQFVHDPGKLTGPGASVTFPTGFGMVLHSSSVSIPWQQPASNLLESVKGYVLTVAEPGIQESRHFEYLIVDPNSPNFDEREPCGPDGLAASCALTLHFPLMGSGKDLTGEGKYHVTLVTIYNDGHRTDGRCDNGTAEGFNCGGAANFPVSAPGVSKWEFFLTREAWPEVFIERQVVAPTGSLPTANFLAPAYLLFVDYGTQSAQFMIWNPGAEASIYWAASTQIRNVTDGLGTVIFGSSDIVGPSAPFRFVGYTVPTLVPPSPGQPQQLPPGCAQVPAPRVGVFGITSSQGCGVFVSYDLRGLPGPPNGLPTARVEVFEGVRL